jgi:hypothetical protein
MNISGVYNSQHGELTIVQTGNKITGTYQNNGVCNGEINGNKVQGVWKNKDNNGKIHDGLFEWIFGSEGNFVGRYKTGSEEGPMRGKWDGTRINEPTTEKIEIARHLEKEEFTYFGAQIAVQKLNPSEVEELLSLLENKKLTTSENRFLSNYYDKADYFKTGIPLNHEIEYVSSLIDSDGLSNPNDIDFFQFESEDCEEQPNFLKDDISKLIFQDGFKLITIRIEDVYLKGNGQKDVPIYPGIQSIPIIGSIIFEESNYFFLDGFYQSNDTRHSFNEDEYELETIWGSMKEMDMDIGEGDGNIYATYQILIYSNGLDINFDEIYSPEDIRNEIGSLNMIVYSNRESDKISFIEIDEDISPFQIEEKSVDNNALKEKVSSFRGILK